MEIFHQCFQYTPSNLSDFIECIFLLQSNIFCKNMFENEDIDRYMHCIMQNLKKMHMLAYTLYQIKHRSEGLIFAYQQYLPHHRINKNQQ